MTGAYIQMAAALLFVVCLILGVAYLFRKKQDRTGLMNIVSYQPIGAKKGVAALKVGGEVLILGVTPNDMRLLKTFKDSDLDLAEQSGFQRNLERFRKIGA